ncbi:MAG: bifunctional nuclease family protein [Acidimicrobiales bacterium]
MTDDEAAAVAETPPATEGPPGEAAEPAAEDAAERAADLAAERAAEDAAERAAEEAADLAPPPPEFLVMDVENVALDLPSQFPSVTLTESEPPFRSLVFPVGLTEGTALALALRRMASPRPMTHELFMEVMQRARIEVIALRVTGRENGNYLAELDLMAPHGRERLPCRPSDGLVLALRMPVAAPVLVDERLLVERGDVVPELPA